VKIAAVEGAVLRDPTSGEETTLVTVVTGEGVKGYGEALANPFAVKAVIDSRRSGTTSEADWDADVQALLVGEDPRDPRRLWRRLKDTTFWSCRAGVGHVALAGIDTALWDLAGKLADVPVWKLLGEARNERPVPYVTVWHGDMPFAETVERSVETLLAAKEQGFRAGKVEALPGNAPDALDGVELVRRAREAVGPDFTLLFDVGYRWNSFDEGIECARGVDDYGLFALEAPFHPERMDDYRRLAASLRTPLATGDMLTAAVEYLPLLESGVVEYLQGGAARTGINEMDALATAAGARGRAWIPWGWSQTTISTAANVHVAVVHDNVPLVEYAPPWLYEGMALRKEIAGPEPAFRDGRFELPVAPGLGIEIDEGAVERLRVA
jgi:L-alanine-DL-glutamate epimerase-like enolase superfamily enzyme